MDSTPLLETIQGPGDVRRLTNAELERLAGELRRRIIAVCSENGGHLAPSLGTVELTLALLAEFDLDRDKLVWDVGHQTYAYKILTGRNR
ncbi:MAG: 1-deoxy-D-xylulose-5-phosphate synthase, partial [Desulfovibrio sp.]|nr:1-deoxy-D-xylulose-5-phosphate synthase [Desulfovibrio sp.]